MTDSAQRIRATRRRGRRAPPLLVAFVLLAAQAAAAGTIAFQTRHDVRVGSAPTAFTLLDPAGAWLAAGGDDGISILRNRGGHFVFSQRSSALRFVKSLAAGAILGGPYTDLAIVHSGGLSVLPGIEAGQFGGPVLLPTAARPVAVSVHPIDRSGTAALFIHADEGMAVLVPSGGSYRSLPIPKLPGTTAANVTDVNADGWPDLLILNEENNRLAVFLGAADGTFQRRNETVTVRAPRRLVVADADADGHLDAFVGGETGVALHLWKPFASGERGAIAPGGGFGPPQWLFSEPHAAGFAVGDLDGDGAIDVAITDSTRDTVRFLMGRSDGTFAAGHAYTVGRGPQDVLLADTTGDGLLDALVLNHLGDSITELPGLGRGEFLGNPSLPGDARDFTAITVGDFNLDGHADLAVASETSGTISLFSGDGRGHFRPRASLRAGRPRALTSGQFGPGSATSIAVADFGGDRVLVFPGDGLGGFGAPAEYPVGGGPTAIVTGVFQGHTDLAVANLLSNSVSVLYGDGRGRFSPAVTSPVGRPPNFLMVGDVNRDGFDDLVVGNDRSSTVAILNGSRRGLEQPRSDQLADVARPLVAEDLDGDGNIDLVATNEVADAIEVLPGMGPGQFASRLTFPVGHHPSAVAAGDFNEDGRPDLAVIHRDACTVSILINTSSATPPPATPVGRPGGDPRRPAQRRRGAR